jgi:hypothetical protein
MPDATMPCESDQVGPAMRPTLCCSLVQRFHGTAPMEILSEPGEATQGENLADMSSFTEAIY